MPDPPKTVSLVGWKLAITSLICFGLQWQAVLQKDLFEYFIESHDTIN